MVKSNSCPICGSANLKLLFKREQVPVHQNLVISDYHKAVDVPRGDLELTLCENCSFVFNAGFDLSKIQYGTNYDNRQDHSPSFQAYMQEIINYLGDECSLQNPIIIEIGCGQGLFLKSLAAITGVRGYGFDPAYQGPATVANGKITFINDIYGTQYQDIAADLVICRHVIEHIAKPLDLMLPIREALKASPRAVVFFETPSLDWILKDRVIYDFFYEHCSYFNLISLEWACRQAGFSVIDKRLVFKDQYMWVKARVNDAPGELPKQLVNCQLALSYAVAENNIKNKWIDKISDLHNNGEVAIWGAGAKGVTFINLIDPFHQNINCAIDLNPNKQGKCIAGTGHPIIDYREIGTRNISTIIIMNPNYRDEIAVLLKQSGFVVSLISWEA